jgi:hypothetical protein
VAGSWRRGAPFLSLSRLGLANVWKEPWVRGAELNVVRTGLVEAELAVHREPDFGRVIVFLAVIFPPADGTQLERPWRIKCLVTATGATKSYINRRTHIRMDAKTHETMTD